MIEKIAEKIVRHRKVVIAIYLILAFISLYGVFNIHINYDIFSYLPQNLSSVKGFRILMDKFALGSTVQAVIPTEDIGTVTQFIDEVEKINGVEKVSFVTDFVDELIPSSFSDEEVVRNYIRNGYSLVRISFELSASDPKTEKAFTEIEKVGRKYGALFSGTVAGNFDMKKEIQSSLIKFGLSAVILVAFVLLMSLPSVAIPATFMASIGMSAIINIGISYYLGQDLSYFARVIAMPLQFAVTMDYALFLYHRFEEERKSLDDEKAMVKSISATFKSVSSASITTIAGFLALTAMQLGTGKDMGFLLARGVFLALLAIVTLLPSLILTVRKVIDRLTHKIFVPDFSWLGEFSAKHSTIIALIFVVIIAGSYVFYKQIDLSFNFKEGMPENVPSQKASDLIAKKFESGTSVFVVYKDADSRRIEEDVDKIEKLPFVSNVFGYTSLKDPLIPDILLPEEAKKQFFKDGYSYVIVNIAGNPNEKEIPEIIDNLQAITKKDGKALLTGEQPMLEDLKKITVSDISRINLYSTIAIFLIIMIAFRSITAPLILVAVIQAAILLNQAIFALADRPMIFIAALAIGAIQLGSTVDYAILLTSRFEEEMKTLKNKKVAIIKAVKESTRPILTSAATMFAATIGIYLFSSIGTIKTLGLLISRGAVISFFAVTVFLPALLYIFQPVIEKTSIKWPREER